MSDDLVRRLECYADLNDAVFHPWVYKEAADHIKKLETNFQLQLEWYLSNKRVLDDRIDKLEAELHHCFHRIEELQAALKKIALDDPDCCMIADQMRETAEIALGLKND